MKRIRKFAAMTLLVGGGSLLAGPVVAQESGLPVHLIEIKGVIDPTNADFLRGQIAAAQDEASALIIELDTPGGLDVSMRRMISDMLDSRVAVVVWIAPRGARAASAGTFITIAANLAYMAEATELGAATPVNLGGGETDETLTRKATNDAVAFITELAGLRGRNAEWAEDAVRDAASIGATEAVEIDVVDGIASSTDEVLQLMDGERVVVGDDREIVLETWDPATGEATVAIERIGMNPLQRLLHLVTQPEVAFMLVSLGSLAVLFELYTSGIGLGGILGAISLMLGFYGLTILPTNWAAVALIVLGMTFFLVDIYSPGLGIWTVGGSVALTGGGLLLFAGTPLSVSPWAIATVVGVTAPFFLFAMTAALRLRRRPSVTGSQAMVGTTGVARTDLGPEGTVMTKGTLWSARSSGDPISAGSKVRVEGTDGLLLIVGPVTENEM